MEARTGLLLRPEQLTAAEVNVKARPLEKPEARAKRVQELAYSIYMNGQIVPVLVTAKQVPDEFDADGEPVMQYEYVDGGARVDAIAQLNTPDGGIQVWCSVVDQYADLYRTAVTSNLHRTQNSVLEMAMIIQEVRERNGWKTRGGAGKVAEYLCLLPSRVSEYEKILRAPKPIRDLIEAGEISTVDAALKLLAQAPEVQERVARVAKEIAVAEAVAAEVLEAASGSEQDTHEQYQAELLEGADAAPGEKEEPASVKTKKEKKADKAEKANKADKPATPQVTAKHVQAAAAQVTGSTGSPLSRTAIVQFFVDLTGLPYPPAAKQFIEYFVDEYVTGKGTDMKAANLFDAAVGFDPYAPVIVPVPAQEAPAKKSAKPAKKKK